MADSKPQGVLVAGRLRKRQGRHLPQFRLRPISQRPHARTGARLLLLRGSSGAGGATSALLLRVVGGGELQDDGSAAAGADGDELACRCDGLRWGVAEV